MAPPSERRSDVAGQKRKAATQAVDHKDSESPAPKRRKVLDGVEDSVEHAAEVGFALLDKLRKARDKKNWPIATHFLTLPDPKQLPDYYEQIGLPIALETIEAKLKSHAYKTTSALESDIKRMIANAKQYNERNSQVFADAEKIRKMVSVYMEDRNPAYRNPSYQPVPTPLPGEEQEADEAEESIQPEDSTDAPAVETPEVAVSGRKSARAAAHSPTANRSARRASPTPAAADDDKVGDTFQGDSFQEAQERIVTEMMNLTDEENNLISANFINLPSRALVDYYRVIKHPVSLKGIQKSVRGVKGRDSATGSTNFQSWDSFENEVGFIWRNAREYNEDGSEISALAGELEEFFNKRVAEARRIVTEPPQQKVKLTMKAAHENPKITLKFGAQKHDAAPAGSAGPNTPITQTGSDRAGTNGVDRARRSVSRDQSIPIRSDVSRRASCEPGGASTGDVGSQVNGVKREMSFGHSPALNPVRANGTSEGPVSSMPPPNDRSSNVASASPHPVVNGINHASQHAPPVHDPRRRLPGKDASDTLITNVSIQTPPDLELPSRFEYDMPAHPIKTQQSITVFLNKHQWKLHITPSLSSSVTQRYGKVFVTCNNVRVSAVPQQDADSGKPNYEIRLMPGTNTIEVECVVGAIRGMPKIGTGPETEREKFTVFAFYQP